MPAVDDLDNYERDSESETPQASPNEGAWDGRLTRIAVGFAGVFRASLNKPQAANAAPPRLLKDPILQLKAGPEEGVIPNPRGKEKYGANLAVPKPR